MRLGQEPVARLRARRRSPRSRRARRPARRGWRSASSALFGPNGPLPLHLTEYARDRAAQRATTPTLAALRRHLPPPHARPVLPRLGRQPADGQPRPARAAIASRTTSARWSASACRALRERDALPDRAKLLLRRPPRGADAQRRGAARRWSATSSACRPRSRSSWASWLSCPTSDRWRLGRWRAQARRAGRRATILGRARLAAPARSSASCSGPLRPRAVRRACCPGGERCRAWRRWCAATSATSSTGTCGWSWTSASRAADAAGRARPARLDAAGSARGPTAEAPGKTSIFDPRGRMSPADAAAALARVNGGDRPCRKSVASRCSASSTAVGYQAIESATVFCKMRGNPYVELVHWLHQILQLPGLGPAPHRPATSSSTRRGWPRDLTEALDRLPRGATSISDLSLARRGRGRARLGLRLAAVRRRAGPHRPPGRRHPQDAELCATRCRASRSEFDKIKVDELTRALRRRSSAARPRTRSRRRRLAVGGGAAPRRGQRRDGARGAWASRRRSRSSRSTSPSRRARARSTRSSAATRRSARSSTS